MSQNRLTELMSALCMALMAGLMWLGDATPAAFALLGSGAALMVAACAVAEFLCPGAGS